MRASLIRRHVQSRHPEILLGLEEGEALEKVLFSCKVSASDAEKSPEKKSAEVKALLSPRSGQPPALNLTPASDACVMCVAPGCKKYIHHSNMARHWRCWHPKLDKAVYIGKRTESSGSSSEFPSPAADADNRLSCDESTPTFKSDSPAFSLSSPMGCSPGLVLQMSNGLYACRIGKQKEWLRNN
jgi:hypothetical protein